MNTCITCKNWVPTVRKLDAMGRATKDEKMWLKTGECRANSPTPIQGAAGWWRVWPTTVESDGCGISYRQGTPQPIEQGISGSVQKSP